jgi:hypothetical protein
MIQFFLQHPLNIVAALIVIYGFQRLLRYLVSKKIITCRNIVITYGVFTFGVLIIFIILLNYLK